MLDNPILVRFLLNNFCSFVLDFVDLLLFITQHAVDQITFACFLFFLIKVYNESFFLLQFQQQGQAIVFVTIVQFHNLNLLFLHFLLTALEYIFVFLYNLLKMLFFFYYFFSNLDFFFKLRWNNLQIIFLGVDFRIILIFVENLNWSS